VQEMVGEDPFSGAVFVFRSKRADRQLLTKNSELATVALPSKELPPGFSGVTRGKRLVVLVGQKKAVAMAVRNSRGRRRWSKLRELLLSRTRRNGCPFSRVGQGSGGKPGNPC
jgi:hypothetical protein